MTTEQIIIAGIALPYALSAIALVVWYCETKLKPTYKEVRDPLGRGRG